MVQSREDVVAAVGARFPRADVERLLTLLDSYGVESYERERERVQMAIVNLSEGSEEKLRDFLAVAKRDYRDVLFWSEYPEEAKIDTPEKRRQIRELFKKLGVAPPSDLDD
jgi:hypothetical protein